MIQNSPRLVRRREPRKSSHPDDLTPVGGVSIGGTMTKEMRDRFLSRVHAGKDDECWEWTGGNFNTGYGRFWDGEREVVAHRIAWEIERGPIPDSLCVLHDCDNPPCVNPAHLWLGTKGDNNRDREAKGRGNQPRGEHHSMAKLTEKEVLAIRASTETPSALAERYGVDFTNIWLVRTRKTWRHI